MLEEIQFVFPNSVKSALLSDGHIIRGITPHVAVISAMKADIPSVKLA